MALVLILFKSMAPCAAKSRPQTPVCPTHYVKYRVTSLGTKQPRENLPTEHSLSLRGPTWLFLQGAVFVEIICFNIVVTKPESTTQHSSPCRRLIPRYARALVQGGSEGGKQSGKWTHHRGRSICAGKDTTGSQIANFRNSQASIHQNVCRFDVMMNHLRSPKPQE